MTKPNLTRLILLLCLSHFTFAQTYEGGDVTALAINPTNPTHILAGGSKGQIWTSHNGTSWQSKTIAPGQIIRHIFFDRQIPHQVFVATAEIGNQSGNLWISKHDGVTFQSRLYERIAALQNQAIRGIDQSASHPDIFAVVTNQGVYRSNDHAQTWQRISPAIPDLAGLHSIAIHPTNPDIIYVGTYHLPMRTNDGGKTWRRAASQATGMIDDSDVFSILTNASNPSETWMSACSGIYRSQNDGAQWQKISGIPSTSRRTHQIYRHPTEKNLYFAGTTQGLWRSANGGQNWQLVTSAKLVVNAITAHQFQPNTIYMATEDAGLWRSLDRGMTWGQINTGIVNRQVGSLYADGETLWAGIVHDGAFGGLFQSRNGKEWKGTDASGSRLLEDVWAIHRSIDKNLYAGTLASGTVATGTFATATSRGLYLKTPTGQWTALSKGTGKAPTGKITAITTWGTSLIVSASNGTFARNSKGWQQIHSAFATTAIVFQQKLWLGTPNGLFVTSDGKTFQRVKDTPILCLTANEKILFVGTDRGLLKSDGTIFRARGGGLPTAAPIHHIAISENNLLVITDGTVFQSDDQGESWQKLKIPHQATTAVRFKNQWVIGTTADGVISISGTIAMGTVATGTDASGN